MSEFLFKYMFFLMQLNTSKIKIIYIYTYNAVTVRIYSSLQIGLQDSLLCSPLIEQRTLVCIFNTFILSLSTPHRILPYLIKA